MLRQTIRWAAVAALLFGAVSCSRDETPGDPEGTVLLNMYNEQNGKTLLSDSDIYINDAGNFISPASCQLFMLGERSGLGGVRVTDLKNPAPEAAVMKSTAMWRYAVLRRICSLRSAWPCRSIRTAA